MYLQAYGNVESRRNVRQMMPHLSRWEDVGAKFPRDDVIIAIFLLPLQFCTIPDAWGKIT